MEPIQFPEAITDLQKPAGWTDEQCKPLPVFTDGNMCISLWKLSFWERLGVLFHGRVWLFVMSGHTQPPVDIQAKYTVFEKQSNVNAPTQ